MRRLGIVLSPPSWRAADSRGHRPGARPLRPAGEPSDLRGPESPGCVGCHDRFAARRHRNRRLGHRRDAARSRRSAPARLRLRQPRRRRHRSAWRARHSRGGRGCGAREQRLRRHGDVLLLRPHAAPRARPRRDRLQHEHRRGDRLRRRPRSRRRQCEHLRPPLAADAARRDRPSSRGGRARRRGSGQRGNDPRAVPRGVSRGDLRRSCEGQHAGAVLELRQLARSSPRPSARP